MGMVRGPNPEKKLRNLKDYSIPSKRVTFYGGVTPLSTSSEPPNTDPESIENRVFLHWRHSCAGIA